MARKVSTADDGYYPLPYPPRACAVSGRAEGEFIDFNVVIDRPEPTRLYISREIIEEVAREHCDMVAGTNLRQKEEWLEHARKELEELRETLETAADLEEKAGPGVVNRKELAANAR